jgi:small-conductance mechanosensitive channel
MSRKRGPRLATVAADRSLRLLQSKRITLSRIAVFPARLHFLLILAALLAGEGTALAQIGPAPPQPPIPSPSDTKKADDDAAAAEKSGDQRSDEEKKAATKSDNSKTDVAKKADDKKASEPPPDPVRQAIQKLRRWSLPGFIAWLHDHAINVVIILLVASAILWTANRLHKRLVRFLAGGRGTAAEQENRARTVVGVMHNALRTAVIALACIMLLEEIGVNIGPLLGGVAVVGLAVAFGTQQLIKDYFTGFLVLLEQQYMIGDVIKVSGNNFSALTGQVEQITLRVTSLRDLDGTMHFIAHGQITVVSNLTHGWSQAVFDLQVPCAEHVDRVRDLFLELAIALRSDAKYGPMILNDPEMLGVESLADATFSVKFVLKTLPLKRWEVKRELLRRIKMKFQELGIKVIVPA